MAADITKTVVTKVELDNKNYVKGLKDQEKAQDSANKSTEEGEESINEMSGALDGMLGQFGLMPGALGKASTGINTMRKGFGSLKTAIIATGIGALIIALTSLFAWFNRTAEGQEKLAIITATIGELFNQLTEIAISMGKTLFDAFENPKQAVKDLWEAIKTNLINRVKAIPRLFEAIGKAISSALKLDFEGVKDASKDVASSIVQMSSGLDEIQQNNVLQWMADKTAEITSNVNKATQIQKEANALRREQIAFITREAELIRDVAAERLKGNDETLTTLEQLEGINKAKELTNTLAKERRGLLSSELDQLERKQVLSSNTLEDEEAAQRLRRQIAELDTQRDTTLKSLSRRQSTLNNALEKENEIKVEGSEINAEEAKKIEEREIKAQERLLKVEEEEKIRQAKKIEDIKLQEEELIKLEQERFERLLENENLLNSELLLIKAEHQISVAKIEEDAAAKTKKLDETTAKNKEELNESIAAAASAAILAIAGDNKELALVLTAVNAAVGVTKTIANVGFPAAIPFLIAQATLVGTQIAAIKGINVPKAARGMMITGRSHGQGGEIVNTPNGLIEAENGEFIMNANSTAMYKEELSRISQAGGGIPIAARGFLVGESQQRSSSTNLSGSLERAISENRAILVTEDLQAVLGRVAVTEDIATL